MNTPWASYLVNATVISALVVAAFSAGFVIKESQAQKELDTLRLESLRTTQELKTKMKIQQKSIELLESEIEATNDFYSRSLGELKHQVLLSQAKLDHVFNSPALSEGWSEYSASNRADLEASVQDEFGFSSRVQRLKEATGRLIEQTDMVQDLVLDLQLSTNQIVTGSPISRGWLSSRFGYRKDPFTGKRKWHSGIDLAGKSGDEIKATAAGVVTFSGNMWGYGNIVVIEHDDNYKTRYAHCKELLVKVGDVIQKGQAIALMGSTGRSTGPHVHYEVVKGYNKVDPEPYIKRGEIL